MNNETYLIISYFVVGVLCFGLGSAAFLFLRRPFVDTIKHLRQQDFVSILRKVFLIGFVFPALIGFCSVSFRSCDKNTYAKIISERSYLYSKNLEQISVSLTHIVFAILAWCAIVFCVLLITSRQKAE